MSIFKNDLFQLVATGFAAGSVITVLAGGPTFWSALVPDLVAAVLL